MQAQKITTLFFKNNGKNSLPFTRLFYFLMKIRQEKMARRLITFAYPV